MKHYPQRWLCCWLVVGALILFAGQAGLGEVVFREGYPVRVVVGAGAGKELREAAEELAQCVRQLSGAKAVVQAAEGQGEGPVIYIGTNEWMRGQGLGLESLDLEGFVIRAVSNTVAVAGRTELGTRHGVYTFMEKAFGVRWFFPGQLGMYLPPRKGRWELGAMDVREEPAYWARYITLHAGPGVREWERHNKLQNHWNVRLKGNSHRMAHYVPVKKYGKEHPEYYMWRQGQWRVPQNELEDMKAAYCLTNPELAGVVAEGVKEYFRTHPGEVGVHMAMNDNAGKCECERCRAAEAGGNYSDVYFGFVNEVAKIVGRSYPEKYVGTLAYAAATETPARLKRLERNVNVYLVVTGRDLYFDPEWKQRQEKLVRRWSQYTGMLCLYDWWFGSCGNLYYQIPTFYPHLIKEHLQVGAQSGVKGEVVEMLPVWAFDPKAYITGKLLWEPGASVDDLMADFCGKMFGGAGETMTEYFGLLEKMWMGREVPVQNIMNDRQFELLRPYLVELKKLLAQARGQARTAEQRERVEFYADGLRASELLAQEAGYAQPLNQAPATEEEVVRCLEAVTKLKENRKPLAEHLAKLEKTYGIGPKVIAPKDRSVQMQTALTRCSEWMLEHGCSKQAETRLREVTPALRRSAVEIEKAGYGALRDLRAGALMCQVKDIDWDGLPELIYRKEGEEMMVAPARGARVLYWKVQGRNVAGALGPHNVAVDATWAPAAFVDGAVTVVSHAPAAGGLVLKTSYTFAEGGEASLVGLRLERDLFVPEKESGFRVNVRLVNPTRERKELAYRHTATLNFLGSADKDAGGWMRMWKESGPFRFQRNFKRNEFRLAGREWLARLDNYPMDCIDMITEPKVQFGGGGMGNVVLEAGMDKEKFHKFICWDHASQEFPTAEFVSENIVLEPGGTWAVSVGWRQVAEK